MLFELPSAVFGSCRGGVGSSSEDGFCRKDLCWICESYFGENKRKNQMLQEGRVLCWGGSVAVWGLSLQSWRVPLIKTSLFVCPPTTWQRYTAVITSAQGPCVCGEARQRRLHTRSLVFSPWREVGSAVISTCCSPAEVAFPDWMCNWRLFYYSCPPWQNYGLEDSSPSKQNPEEQTLLYFILPVVN